MRLVTAHPCSYVRQRLVYRHSPSPTGTHETHCSGFLLAFTSTTRMRSFNRGGPLPRRRVTTFQHDGRRFSVNVGCRRATRRDW